MAEEITARQIRGNTWGLFLPRMVVPYCHLTQKEIILLDSGCLTHGEVEQFLADRGLRVRAILTTHAHWDHIAAHAGLQRRDGAQIWMPKQEAALQATELGRLTVNPNGNYEAMRRFYQRFPYRVDEEIGLEDGTVTVCGMPFSVLQTPGHSLGHVCYITPDDVLYAGDALMTDTELRQTKLSYAVSVEVDLQSKEKLRHCRCSAYVAAHAGVEQELGPLIDRNIDYIRRRTEEVWRLIRRPMSMEEIQRMLWRHFSLRPGSYYKNLGSGNMLRALVQYLVSTGRLECRYDEGVDYYARTKQQEGS